MTWQRLGADLAIFAALFTGRAIYFALEVVYLATRGGLVFLTGIPTPGGAPLSIHLINVAIKGGWAALGYGLVLRLLFGRLNVGRLACLWLFGLGCIGGSGHLAISGNVPIQVIGNAVLLIYLLFGQIVARDWVSK
jgi:hypothetical protein